MSTKLQVGLMTAVAVLLFMGLRKLPKAQCTFLHYQSPTVLGDGLEFCGDETPTFIALDHLVFPIQLTLNYEAPLSPGKTTHFDFTLKTSDGKVIQPHELAIAHTKLLHVLILDPSLDDYHHIHPEPLGPFGQWGFSLTPQKSGPYQLFAEFVPARTQQKVIAVAEFQVPADPEKPLPPLNPVSTIGSPILESTPVVLSTSVESNFRLKFTQAVQLEPVMGTLGHMVAFDEDLSGFAHLHPKYTGAERDPMPELAFAFNTSKPGKYRLWAQVKISGKERFFPFDVVVQK